MVATEHPIVDTIVHWRVRLPADGMTSHSRIMRGAITVRQAQANTQGAADAMRPFPMKRISAFLLLVAGATATSVAGADDADAAKLAAKYNCQVCHSVDKKRVGPAFREIGKKYSGDAAVAATLQGKVRNGSTGTWGSIPMPPNNVPETDLVALVEWILSLK